MLRESDFLNISHEIYRLSYLAEFVKKNKNQNLKELEDETKRLLIRDCKKLREEIVKIENKYK